MCKFVCPTDFDPYFNQKFLPFIPCTLRNVMAYLVDFHSNFYKITFLSNGNSLNIDFQGTEGLSRNLISTLLPNLIDPLVRITSPNTKYRALGGRYELPVFKTVEVIHGK